MKEHVNNESGDTIQRTCFLTTSSGWHWRSLQCLFTIFLYISLSTSPSVFIHWLMNVLV